MAKRKKVAGRAKGTPNKVTGEARALFNMLLENLGPKVERWIEEAAGDDPGKAADLVIKLAEFCVPKLSRHQVDADVRSRRILDGVADDAIEDFLRTQQQVKA